MSDIVKKVIKLSITQYDELMENQEITINGETYELDTSGNTIYITDQGISYAAVITKLDYLSIIQKNDILNQFKEKLEEVTGNDYSEITSIEDMLTAIGEIEVGGGAGIVTPDSVSVPFSYTDNEGNITNFELTLDEDDNPVINEIEGN